jgi:glucuronide carrier protein
MASTPTNMESTTEGMPRRRVVSYAMGDAANNVSFQMTSLFLMAYMTDMAGVPPP